MYPWCLIFLQHSEMLTTLLYSTLLRIHTNNIQLTESAGGLNSLMSFDMFFFIFLLNIFTQDIPLGWKPLQMWGPAQHTLLHKQ